jgi:diacylglycerol kinase (ATP)
MNSSDPHSPGRSSGRLKSFNYAFRGLAHLIRTEPNARIHATAAVLAIAAGWWFHIAGAEWLAVCICIAMVFAAECFNTALEYLADRVTMLQDPLVGKAKDLAAGAVLITSIGAASVGLFIFLPRILALFSS